MKCIGLDIGGANLKVATNYGVAREIPFELWKRREELADTIAGQLREFPEQAAIALTMTGELADCYTTKAEGVEHIIQSVQAAAPTQEIYVWTTAGKFVSPAEAIKRPLETAAANWQAIATWAGRFAPSVNSVLLDVGSTTTDIIPLVNGRPCSRGLTDVTRLQAGELVYLGARRTPLCALAETVNYHEMPCPLAAEWFATTYDVALWLGVLPEAPESHQTANNGPATRAAAWDRLARQICCDREEFTPVDADLMARDLEESLFARWDQALSRVVTALPTAPECCLLSGSGNAWMERFLAGSRQWSEIPRMPLTTHFPANVVQCACAYAVAILCGELLMKQSAAH